MTKQSTLADEMERAANLPEHADDWIITGDKEEPFEPRVYAEEIKLKP